MGRKYVRTISALEDLPRWRDAFEQRSWRTHPLRGGRKGTFAVDLGDRVRLIVTPHGQDALTVEEVSAHYDD